MLVNLSFFLVLRLRLRYWFVHTWRTWPNRKFTPWWPVVLPPLQAVSWGRSSHSGWDEVAAAEAYLGRWKNNGPYSRPGSWFHTHMRSIILHFVVFRRSMLLLWSQRLWWLLLVPWPSPNFLTQRRRRVPSSQRRLLKWQVGAYTSPFHLFILWSFKFC